MTAALERTNGHKVDVDALYRQQRGRLVGHAAKVGRDPHAAEDAVQEAFVDLIGKNRQADNPAAYVTVAARNAAINDARHRGRQAPVGEHMDREPDRDTSGNGFAACLGDPRVAELVATALKQLPVIEAAAVRAYCLDGRRVREIATEAAVNDSTIRSRVRRGLELLRQAGHDLPDLDEAFDLAPAADEPATVDKKLSAVEQAAERLRADFGATPPADLPGMSVLAKRYGWDNKKTSAARLAYTGAPQQVRVAKKGHANKVTPPTVEQLADALTKVVGSERLGVDGAEAILRKRFGTCSRNRAIEAKDMHNDRHGHPRRVWPGGRRADEATPSATPKGADSARTSAATPVATPVVAEAWLSTSGAQVTCMFVNSDESTTKHPAVFRSMAGAQREITGHLVGDGYKPTGPWVNHSDDESSRNFSKEGN